MGAALLLTAWCSSKLTICSELLMGVQARQTLPACPLTPAEDPGLQRRLGRKSQHLHSGYLHCSTGQAVQARRCGDISLAYMDSTSPHIFSGETQDAFKRVREAVRTPLYGYGMCCVSATCALPSRRGLHCAQQTDDACCASAD